MKHFIYKTTCTKILRQFIREEMTWNYWLRRPRNNQIKGLGQDIEDSRADTFKPVADNFQHVIRGLEHAIKTGSSVHDIENSVVGMGLDAYEIVSDITAFEQAVVKKDVAEVKRQLLSGLQSWASQIVKNTAEDGYNYSTLQGILDRSE